MMEMHRNEKSLAEIQFHLRHIDGHHIDAARSTIKRYIDSIKSKAKVRDESLFE